jgi:hypothetical protein
MAKFVLGVVLGAVLAFGYVRWNVSLPAFLALPEQLRGNLVSAATEADLYDLDRDSSTRRRALEVLFANRAEFAATVDAEAGHPFLAALFKARAVREARRVVAQWPAFDDVLAKPALREALVRKHGTVDTTELKQAMLVEALGRQPFLEAWLARHVGQVRPEDLREILGQVGAGHDIRATGTVTSRQ